MDRELDEIINEKIEKSGFIRGRGRGRGRGMGGFRERGRGFRGGRGRTFISRNNNNDDFRPIRRNYIPRNNENNNDFRPQRRNYIPRDDNFRPPRRNYIPRDNNDNNEENRPFNQNRQFYPRSRGFNNFPYRREFQRDRRTFGYRNNFNNEVRNYQLIIDKRLCAAVFIYYYREENLSQDLTETKNLEMKERILIETTNSTLEIIVQ